MSNETYTADGRDVTASSGSARASLAGGSSSLGYTGLRDSGVTVRDVLNLALPEGTTVVSGAAGLGRTVTWARVIRLDRDPQIESGELALAVLPDQAEAPHALLASMLQTLAARGVAALAVADRSPGAQILAEAVGTPLLALPAHAGSAHAGSGGAPARIADIEKAVISLIVNQRAELEQRGVQIYRRLAQYSIENRGIEAIVETLAQITGKPVVVEDVAGPIIFSAAPPARAISQDDLGAALRDPDGLRPLLDAASLSPTSPPIVHRQLAAPGWSRFVAPIIVGAEVTSFLSILGQDDELDEIDRVAVGRAAAVCALELAKRQAINEAEKRIRSDFLDDLFNGRFADDAVIASRGQPLGFDVTQPYAVVIFDLDTSDAYLEWMASRNEQSIQRLRQSFSRGISDEVARAAPGALLRVESETAAMLFPMPVSPPPVNSASAHLASSGPNDGRIAADALKAVKIQVEQIRQRAASRLDGITLSAGVGRHYPRAADTTRAYREAEQALAIARRLFGTRRTTTFDELGIYRLLFHLHGTTELEGYYDETLRSIVDHDERHHSDLIPTLRAFFACHGNLSRTAEMLYLHRNTVSYRLQRIEEISGLKLDAEEDRFRLQLALKLLDIV